DDVALAGPEADEVPPDAPLEGQAAQQLGAGERRRQAEARGDDAQALALALRIEVDHDENRIALPALREREQVLALRLEQLEVREMLQRRVLAAYRVQPRRQGQQHAVERTLAHLVLLRVEVLLAALA